METKPITADEASSLNAQEFADAINEKDKIINELEKERDQFENLYNYLEEKNRILGKKLEQVKSLMEVATQISTIN